jgi:hypothetical protein
MSFLSNWITPLAQNDTVDVTAQIIALPLINHLVTFVQRVVTSSSGKICGLKYDTLWAYASVYLYKKFFKRLPRKEMTN